jgi:protein-L-isoaspartate(D-aspartate) O-methyltransferase
MAGLGFTQGERRRLPIARAKAITAAHAMPGESQMADFATARRRMVDNQLRTSNITDRRILTAMEEVPRERFVPEARQELAYADVPLALGQGRWLAPAAPFAKLIQLAEIQHTDSVLDVGAGTGYSTAVLAQLAASVTALESDPSLATTARDIFANAFHVNNAQVVEGPLDGAGLPHNAYDVIVVEGAVESVPASLFPLLKDGGRLVALLRRGGAGVAHVYVRSAAGIATRAEFNAALPPLAAVPREESFVF